MENGYVSNGNWTLGQACSHIADWMRFPLDGFPNPPWPIRAMMWVMKHTVGPGMKRKILAEGFQGGMPTAPETVPAPGDMTDRQGVEKLQETAYARGVLRRNATPIAAIRADRQGDTHQGEFVACRASLRLFGTEVSWSP